MLSRRIQGWGEVMPPGFSTCYQEDSESILKFRSYRHTSETPQQVKRNSVICDNHFSAFGSTNSESY